MPKPKKVKPKLVKARKLISGNKSLAERRIRRSRRINIADFERSLF